MKRSELKVGQAYWYARSTNWLEYTSQGNKVVVVDDGHWQLPTSSMWTRDREPRKTTSGNGVLVDITSKRYGSDEEETHRTVINLTHIRGPYDETLKKVEEFSERRRALEDEKQEKRNVARQQVSDAIALATQLGFQARHGTFQTDEVVISASELIRMLNRIAAK